MKFQLIFVVQYVDPVQHLVVVIVLEEVLVQVAVAEELDHQGMLEAAGQAPQREVAVAPAWSRGPPCRPACR